MKQETNSNENNVFAKMKQMAGSEMVTLPPRCHEYLEGEFVEYVEGQSITMKFPIYEKYNNPAGVILGGFMPLFFDATMGPLSYLLAQRPVTTLDINTTFLRPIMASQKYVTVSASLVNLSKSYLFLEGKAFNPENKLVATSTSRLKILNFS